MHAGCFGSANVHSVLVQEHCTRFGQYFYNTIMFLELKTYMFDNAYTSGRVKKKGSQE